MRWARTQSLDATEALMSSECKLDLTRVGGQLTVSDVNADEGSPYDAGSDTKLPARI